MGEVVFVVGKDESFCCEKNLGDNKMHYKAANNILFNINAKSTNNTCLNNSVY